jgi:hypothetical protein
MVWKRIVVGDQERLLITKNGRFGGILSPGEYRMFVPPGDELATEKYNLRSIIFDSIWSDYLVEQRPKLVERYFTRVETNDVQIALVYVDAKLYSVLTPAKRVLYWRDAANVTAEFIDVIADPAIRAEELPFLESAKAADARPEAGKDPDISSRGVVETAAVLRGFLNSAKKQRLSRSTNCPASAAADQGAMLGGPVGRALGLRGPRRPAITCFAMRLQRPPRKNARRSSSYELYLRKISPLHASGSLIFAGKFSKRQAEDVTSILAHVTFQCRMI